MYRLFLIAMILGAGVADRAEAGFRVNRAHRVIDRHDCRVQRRHDRSVPMQTVEPPKAVKIACACPDCTCGANCDCKAPCCCGNCSGQAVGNSCCDGQ
jgi:hypothetical protein